MRCLRDGFVPIARNGLSTLIVLIGLCSLVIFPVKSGAVEQVSEFRLEAAERKCFHKSFQHDPIDKRLQRLELLVFGATQFGTNSERWAQLQQSIDEKKTVGGQGNRINHPCAKDAFAITSLERQVLKKTFPNDLAARRLDRLEARVFGQASPSMPSERRIDRLKRTTGLMDETGEGQTAVRPFVPEDRMMPVLPFGGSDLPGFGQFGERDPQMAELLKQMQAQMRAFEQFGMVPKGNTMPNMPEDGIHQFHFYYQLPDGKPHYFESPQPKGNPSSPDKTPSPGQVLPDKHEIPPYGDPNSI